jgi:hypothetical protein
MRPAPAPHVGMRVIDTLFPHAPWAVVQYDGPGAYIYLRREHDGRLFHHDASSWAHAWKLDHFAAAPSPVAA